MSCSYYDSRPKTFMPLLVLPMDGVPIEKAAVTMTLPKLALHDCVMTLESCESKVEDLAKDLFGISLASTGNLDLSPADGTKPRVKNN